ncbi:MAG: hypothetical protein EOM88_00800 [Clostridia bacterium]|jgi:hypothetical protein|nr:hypothetical protein [Clostridia bacterium]
MDIKEQFKKYWWLLLIIILIVFVSVVIILQFKSLDQDVKEAPAPSITALELEFLSNDELKTLGAEPDQRAQVISRDPLVYKIIRSDSDIVRDLKELDKFR